MFAPYREILALPGARAFTAWGLLARIQMGMTGLATFLLVQIEYGSYEKAGLVVGAVALSYAAVSPKVAQLVDRHGQARVLRIGYALAITGRIAMVWAALAAAPLWVLLLIAPTFSLAGTQSTLSRARWTHIVPDRDALNTAFSLESSLEEVLFIMGPALATILATSIASWVPSVIALTTLGLGGYAFLSLRETEPPARRHTPGGGAEPANPARASSRLRIPRPLRGHLLVTTPALVLTTMIFMAQGALFASVDASTVAFAEELGHKSWSGPVLAVFALGSLVGGLAYGARVWAGTLASRLLWGVIATGLGAATFWIAPNLTVLGILMFLTGLAVAPTMAVGDGVVHALVPRSRVTEGMTWTRTGIDLGIAAGAWAAGAAIDRSGAQAGFAVTAYSGIAAVAIMLVSWRYLRTRRHYEETVTRAPGTIAS